LNVLAFFVEIKELDLARLVLLDHLRITEVPEPGPGVAAADSPIVIGPLNRGAR